MKIYRLSPDSDGVVTWPRLDASKGSTVTIGTFDGMHKGHQAVLRRVVDLARSYSTRSVAIVFDPRPAFVFDYRRTHDKTDPAPGVRDPQEILPVEERLRLMEQIGLDIAIVVRFTTPFAQTSYSSFLGQLISQRVPGSHNPVHTLGLHTLVLGSDARLGRDGAGTAQSIARIAEAFRFFQADIVDDKGPGFTHIPDGVVKGVPVEKKVRVWSSSNLRFLLQEGEVAQVRDITGRDHVLAGTVVHGEGRGTGLGFPTANLGDIKGLVPGDGVYEGWLVDEEQSQELRLPAAISIGTKPTFGEGTDRAVEANVVRVPDSAGQEGLDLYGHHVRLEFADRIDDQKRFASVDDLVAAMGTWCDRVRHDLA